MPDGFRITTCGEGPEVVLVHGWAMHSGIWGGVVDALASEYRVNLVDLPGHGVNRHVPLSPELEEVSALILSELPPATWIGWSLGGLIALQAASQQAEKVERLVMVGATPSFCKQPGWDYGVDATVQQAFSDALENDYEGTISQFCLQTFGKDQVNAAMRRLGEGAPADLLPERQVLLTGLHLLYGNSLLPCLNACKMPTLYLGGEGDRTVRAETLRQAAARMPAADVAIISGAGHAPFISHEEEFLRIIRGFMHTGIPA